LTLHHRYPSASLLQQSVKTSSEVSLAVAWSNDQFTEIFAWSNISDLSLGYEFLKAQSHQMLYGEGKEGPLSNSKLLKCGSSFVLLRVC
jgi:hypothetical protein